MKKNVRRVKIINEKEGKHETTAAAKPFCAHLTDAKPLQVYNVGNSGQEEGGIT
jgi:hypothetical protein